MLKKMFFFFVFCNFSFSQIVINEFDSDSPSTDVKEFVEFKSVLPFTSLNGHVLVFYDGNTLLSYLSIDLDGITTDSNGIATIGGSQVSPVPNKYFPFDSAIQNGPDGVGLYLGNKSDFPEGTKPTVNNLVDALIHKTGDANPTNLMTALGATIAYDEGATTTLSASQSIQLKNDGTFESKTPTPGANNDGTGVVFNGITINVDVSNKNENQSFDITFTTQKNVTENLNFDFSLNNFSFNTDDYSGNNSITIPIGEKTAKATIQLIDDAFDEGDEILNIKFGIIPSGYIRMNDNIQIRVVDNDFKVLDWGTPLNPTYGLVPNLTPTGYYDSLQGLSGDNLKQAIQNIIANPAVVREHNYSDATNILKEADQNPKNSNEVWLMYTEIPRSKLDFQTGNSNVGKWNREHIFSQSRANFNLPFPSPFADGINVWDTTDANDIEAGGSDAHHLRAEDGPENSSRNNRNYGVDYNGPTNSKGSWHGDVARALFYMAVRYNGLQVVNGNVSEKPKGFIGDLATLLLWNQSDPADDFEMNRNNIIYNWQQNRNPFIDHPDLANYIWGAKTGQTWNSTLSISNSDRLEVAIFPNPSHDFIEIKGISSSAWIAIKSISGVEIYEGKYKTNERLSIPFPAGIYFMEITQDGKSTIKKLLVK
jgi:hypothetical protein